MQVFGYLYKIGCHSFSTFQLVQKCLLLSAGYMQKRLQAFCEVIETSLKVVKELLVFLIFVKFLLLSSFLELLRSKQRNNANE